MPDLSKVVSSFNEKRFLLNLDKLRGDIVEPRVAYTLGEEERHRYLRLVLSQIAGVECFHDNMGNTLGKTENNSGSPQIIVGSHLDNMGVGTYDGVLGVAIGLEVITCLTEHQDKLEKPVGVCAFRAEESTRFNHSLIGSKIVIGGFSTDDIIRLTDQDSVSLYRAAKEIGYDPEKVADCRWNTLDVALFIEPHAEQGPILYNSNIPVGIVNSIAAPVRYEIKLKGVDAHSGATDMHSRRDVKCCSAEITLLVENLAKQYEERNKGLLRATVPYDEVKGKSLNKVPGNLTLYLDIRRNKKSLGDKFEAELIEGIEKIAERRHIDLEMKKIDEKPPVESLDTTIYNSAASLAEQLSIPYKIMPSGASHDAVNIYHYGIPVLMLFGDSVDGLAHNENERTTKSSAVDLCRLTLACAYEHARGG